MTINLEYISAVIIPAITPEICPNIDTFLLFKDGIITVKIIDNNSVKSKFLTITNSHVIRPNNNPEIPIPHGIDGKSLYVIISNNDDIINILDINILNFLAPNVRSIREREYNPKRFPIR